jgi:hypothetical protein
MKKLRRTARCELSPRRNREAVGPAVTSPEPARDLRATRSDRAHAVMHVEWALRVQEDYAYVKRDLKRITWTSTLLMTVLVLAWLVLEAVEVGL